VPPLFVATSQAMGSNSPAPYAGTPSPAPDLGASISPPPSDTMISSYPLLHGGTQLQNNIVKPKKLFPDMVRWGNFCATGEPDSLDEALHDSQWKQAMDAEFALKDVSLLDYFFGIEVKHCSHGLLLSQEKYTLDILHRAGMKNCKPMSTPIQTYMSSHIFHICDLVA
jgi:hypothetical protein